MKNGYNRKMKTDAEERSQKLRIGLLLCDDFGYTPMKVLSWVARFLRNH